MSDYPDFRKSFPKGDPDGPTSEELREKYRLKFRKGPSKFEGPVGFRQVNYKRKFADRYPRFAIAAGSLMFMSLFFGPVLFKIFKTPSIDEQYIQELKKQRFVDAGVYQNPFTKGWRTTKEDRVD